MRLLRAFIALDETRQFTLAAQRCSVTQSAFSQMIGRLESQLGVRLFERDTRSVRPTAEGALFAAKAREILALIEQSVVEVRHYADRQFGRLALAMIPSLAATWLPPLLAGFRGQYPGITLAVHDLPSERCLQQLREDRVELAVTSMPGPPGEFIARTLFEERFVLLCTSAHLPGSVREVGPKHLRGLPFVHLVHTERVQVASDAGINDLRPLLRAFGVDDLDLEVEHAATLAGLVRSGFGVSVIPESMARQFSTEGLLTVPVAASALRRRISLVRRHGQVLTPAAAGFVERLEANVPGATPSPARLRPAGARRHRRTAPAGPASTA